MSNIKSFAVMIYTNRREENSWKLHRVYENKQDAIDFCYTLFPTFEKKYENFVDPVGNIVFKTTCGMIHPLRKEILIGEELEKYKQEYELYKNKSENFDHPFDGLSWKNPQVCVMEVDYFNNRIENK
jgi:hypothetical protein